MDAGYRIFVLFFALFNFGFGVYIYAISSRRYGEINYRYYEFGVYIYAISSLMSALSFFTLYVLVDYSDLAFGLIIGVVLLLTRWGC